MRTLGILLVLVLTTGCAPIIYNPEILTNENTPPLEPPPERKHIRVDEEVRRDWDKKTVKLIEKHRQIVHLEGGWQVMAYCTMGSVETAMRRSRDDKAKTKGVLCRPPRAGDDSDVRVAATYVLSKRLTTRPETPGAWSIRLMNRTRNHMCMYVGWKFIDMKADDFSLGWHYLKPYETLDRGVIRQEDWEFFGQRLVFDYWGHVNTLYIRGATSDGQCIGDLQGED